MPTVRLEEGGQRDLAQRQTDEIEMLPQRCRSHGACSGDLPFVHIVAEDDVLDFDIVRCGLRRHDAKENPALAVAAKFE